MTRTEQARAYAQKWRGKYRKLSEETGLGYWWITKFAQGRIEDPSANRVDELLAHQSQRNERRIAPSADGRCSLGEQLTGDGSGGSATARTETAGQ